MVDYDTLEGMERELLRLVEYERNRKKKPRKWVDPYMDREERDDLNVRKLADILQTFGDAIHPLGESGAGYCLFRNYCPPRGWTDKLKKRQDNYFILFEKHNLGGTFDTEVPFYLQYVLVISDIVGRDISAYELISSIHSIAAR